MKRPIERWAAVLAGVLLIGGFLVSQRSHPPAARPAGGPAAPPIKARVATSRKVGIPILVEAVGTVRSRHLTIISSRLVAQVERLLKQPGDAVKAGEPLVVLDSRDLKARAAQAEAALRGLEERLKNLHTELERTKNLFAKEAATQQDLDASTSRLAEAAAQREAAEKALEEVRIQLDHAVITAPFEGLVFEKHVDPGDLAAPGKPLLGIYDPTRLRLEALVEERLLWRLKPRDMLEVSIDAPGRSVTGEVSEIVPAVDPITRTGTVKIDLPSDPDLQPGMFGRARVPAGNREAIVVPAAAVQRRGQLEVVFAVAAEAGKPALAGMRLVRSGENVVSPGAEERLVEVLSGLDAGVEVILSPPPDLRDGTPLDLEGEPASRSAGSKDTSR